MPEVGVVGGGAVGLFLAHALSQAEHIPYLCVRRKAQLRAIEQGITLEEGKTQLHRRVKPLLKVPSKASVDILFFCTKAYDLEKAMDAWMGMLKKGGTVLFLQNGIGFWKQLSRRSAAASLNPYALSLTFGITKASDSRVLLRGRGRAYLGSLSDTDRERTLLCCLLNEIGLSPQYEENILSFLKRKAILNACINPVTALLEVQNGRLLHPVFQPLLKQCVVEVGARQEAAAEMLKFVQQVAEQTQGNKSSMLQDIQQAKQTEIAYLNEQFHTPTHTLLSLLVKAKQCSFS